MATAPADKRAPHKEARWIGSWRAEIAVRIAELEHRLEVVKKLGPPVPARANVGRVEAVEIGREGTVVAVEIEGAKGEAATGAVWSAHVHAVETALGNASRALENLEDRLAHWWTGSTLTVAWESVHDAEAELVELESPDAMVASLPRLEAWLKEVVPDKSLRSRYVEQLGAYMRGDEEPDSGVVRQAYQVATVANNDKHANARAFRNRLIVATFVLAGVLLVMALWHVFNREFLSLCGKAPDGNRVISTCYGGESQSSRWAVFEVLLLGAAGGTLSVAFSLGRVRHAASRYSLRGPQTFLKPVAGAATALFGVLLVLSGLLVSPAGTSQEVLVAYAAVFGFAQHLFTRFVDKRADAVIGVEEEKDREKTD